MQKLLENLPKVKISPNFYKSFPESPGVYIYFKGNSVIYIGKAINLKRRISSYFDLDLEPKTARMISEANFISYIQVNSELEALLLEAKLIRKYMPHYNIAAKDDKHPLYIRITKEEFPRVVTVRKMEFDTRTSIAFYGPFPSSANVKSVLKLIRKIFPFSDHKISKRPCLYSHIGLCNPCPSEVLITTDNDKKTEFSKIYKKNIKNIKTVLDGKIDFLTRSLDKEMRKASAKQDYESAARFRNQISQLEYITRPQMPTDFYMENPNLYEDIRKKEITELEELSGVKNIIRIECFDIAHLAGSMATASMVTFINAEADKSFYRHFRIKKARGGDDYGSMSEVARRRAEHFSDWGKPDLIIVDGGVGQVVSFSESLNQTTPHKVPVVGIAKHPDRLIVGDSKTKLSGSALNLVSRMRDEAHRFARRYHHQLVSKSITNPDV